jgi:signal transduction histidine kinase
MRIVVFLFFLALFYLSDKAIAQQHRFHQYRVEQGLPSDVIKAVTEDSLGFIWIATDDGLVKYDGLRFSTYKDAVPGQYVKGFLHTKSGKLVAFGDLSAVEIVNLVDTVVFKPFLRGERFVNDSTLFFPKSIYEDKSGNVWFGEPKSVSKFDGQKLTRYDLGEANRSNVFVRSFSFFEAAGDLYATAYNGNLFRYSPKVEKFLPVKDWAAGRDISAVLMLKDKVLVAARDGLFISQFVDGAFAPAKNLLPVGQISNLLMDSDSSVYVTTYGEDLYHVRFDRGLQAEKLDYKFSGINSCYLSRENDLWASTDQGLILVQKNLFMLSDPYSLTHFIEGIAFDPIQNKLFYCNKELLVELQGNAAGDWSRRVIEEDKNGYFQCLQFDGEKLWASTRWEVLVLGKSGIERRYDFSNSGNFVHDIFIDSKKNVWLSQAGTSTVKMIDPAMGIHTFAVEGMSLKDVNVVREGKDGMYLSTSGLNGYLCFKAHNSDIFKNISLPIPFSSGADFNVSDIAVDSTDRLWLATTDGLLMYKAGKISRVSFESAFERYPVTSVEVLDNENVLFSNSFGLFRLSTKTGEYWLYDENTGLPSNTITDHGIYVAPDKKVWIGSSFGIAHATGSLLEDRRTKMPYCVDARVNGNTARFVDGVTAPHGSFVTLRFSPVSFPENRVSIQWRFSGEKRWKSLQSSQLELSNMLHGKYKIEFRAKKNTGLTWSRENSVSLIIQPPYWKKPQFVLAVLLLIVFIAWASYAISAVIMNRRKQYLEKQINDRTQELQQANDELKQRNAELDRFVYSASHDLSAPLKSILGLIRVSKMDTPPEGHLEYLNMMERSVHKLELFIQEVVTYSRNARMPLNYEAFEFEPFVRGLLQDHEYAENYERIKFTIEDSLGTKIISDMTRMKIIMNNLLSNAIKFHWLEDGRNPVVNISICREHNHYILKVSDNGRGIQEHHIKRIFEMFYRAAEDAQGSGLGLYILKESVLKLGGTVEAHSKPEQGTTFTIKLPVPSAE